MNRRDFLMRVGAASLGISAAAKFNVQPGAVLGANDTIVCGVIGTGRIAWDNMACFQRVPGGEIAAVSDVYRPHLQKGVELTGGKAAPYPDFRSLLDRQDIDAVLICTPDHWHALTAIMACEAGKDVYVEKPISHNIVEGRRMVDYARRYNRVVQVGTQQRSGEHFKRAVELVRSGKLGKISYVKTWNFGNSYPNGIGNTPDSNPPSDLDWNM